MEEHRQGAGTADLPVRPDGLAVRVEFEVRERTEPFLQTDRHLEAGKVRADAAVDPEPEAGVPVARTVVSAAERVLGNGTYERVERNQSTSTSAARASSGPGVSPIICTLIPRRSDVTSPTESQSRR